MAFDICPALTPNRSARSSRVSPSLACMYSALRPINKRASCAACRVVAPRRFRNSRARSAPRSRLVSSSTSIRSPATRCSSGVIASHSITVAAFMRYRGSTSRPLNSIVSPTAEFLARLNTECMRLRVSGFGQPPMAAAIFSIVCSSTSDGHVQEIATAARNNQASRRPEGILPLGWRCMRRASRSASNVSPQSATDSFFLGACPSFFLGKARFAFSTRNAISSARVNGNTSSARGSKSYRNGDDGSPMHQIIPTRQRATSALLFTDPTRRKTRALSVAFASAPKSFKAATICRSTAAQRGCA